MDKATPGSYWMQHLTFCECMVITGREVRKFMSRMKKIPPNMVLNYHVNGTDTIFATISGTLTNNPMGKCLGLIIRGT